MKLPGLKEIDAIRKTGLRPGVVACFLHDKKILFLFKEEYNLWQLPQGGIDNQESIEQAIVREMNEELGNDFAASLKINSLVGDNQVNFPTHNKNSRELKTDASDNIFMEGKKYFFIAIDTDISDLDIKKTEFDDFKWLDYGGAIEVASMISQQGKRRVTLDAINKFHDLGLL